MMTRLSCSLLLTITSLLSPFFLSAQAYLNPSLPVEERVEDLLSRMTLAEKIGQMTQAERNMTTQDIQKYFLGSVLNGGGSVPFTNTTVSWADMIDGMQSYAMSTRLRFRFYLLRMPCMDITTSS